VRTRK